jgi:hypothetical protein
MKPFIKIALLVLLMIFTRFSFSQISVYLPTIEDADSLLEDNELLRKPITDTKIYIYQNLINTSYSGFADLLKRENDFQIYDFLLFGRPQLIAPVNMLPHQTNFIKDNIYLNQTTSGLFNTRFLSPDQTHSLYYGSGKLTSVKNTFFIKPLERKNNQPFTRVKFYEGDARFSDLDIHFTREIYEGVHLKLAGFNRGFPGSNRLSNSVMYDTRLKFKLNEKTTSIISWERNHDRSTLFPADTTVNSFINGGDLTKTGLRFIYKEDTIKTDNIEVGLVSVNNRHINYSRVNNFNAAQKSDDYSFYISQNVSTPQHSINGIFSIRNNYIWGNAFDKKFSQAVFTFNINDQWKYTYNQYFEAGGEIQFQQDYDPLFNGSFSWNYLAATNHFSRIEAAYFNRFPSPLESSISYNGLSGNADLTPERHLSLTLLQRWQLLDFLFLQGKAGVHRIYDEIIFNGNEFLNAAERDWMFISGEGGFRFWNLLLSGGGRIVDAETNISPGQSAWSALTYHGPVFDGIIVLDITVDFKWNGVRDRIYYNPFIHRFYQGSGQNPSYSSLGVKFVGTVSDAEIFLEMENLMQERQENIYGYIIDSRKVRFGVNWELWD